MALDENLSSVWKAMDIGPEWILRTKDDLAPPKEEIQPTLAPRSCLPPSFEVPVSPKKEVIKIQTEDNASLCDKAKTASWDELKDLISQCKACEMASSRTNCVFSDGAPGCPIVIVGEAPGRDEDLQGVPFVGKSGQLLTNILSSVGLTRGKEVAILNVLKCRPPKNRDPESAEIAKCSAFLNRQLELMAPKVLVLMGRFAANSLLKEEASVGHLRNSIKEVQIAGQKVPTIVTYHPSYLLRSPTEKEKSWQDFVRVKNLLKESENEAN